MPHVDDFMQHAIRVARRNPTYPFGAVLVDPQQESIVAEGWNRGQSNPTWHGEIDAINRYCENGNRDDLRRLHLYTTAEPCCMCQGALLWAGIVKVGYGTSIRRLQALGWNQIDILAEEVVRRTPFATCVLQGGILAESCDALFVAALALQEGEKGTGFSS